MKYLILFSALLISFMCTQKEFKLNGKYIMQYEKEYNSQDCVVNFHDSIYTRILSSGKHVKGHIIYKKFSVSLNDDKSTLQMDFAKTKIQRDTIFFGTKNTNDKPSNDLLLISGRLIKVK